MNENILEFKNISKSYSTVQALKNISFSIPENSIFGILGENGSGKSTFMKILPGLIYDWSGEIYYNNHQVNKHDLALKDDFGYLIEAPTFYEHLSAQKNLEMLARISKAKSDSIQYVLDLVELSERSHDKVDSYSYGMKQRLGIAQALLHDPKIIILDEPNNGLDPNGIDDMTRLIKKLKSDGKTICLSTHNLRDVEEICTDFTVFQNGKNSKPTSIENQLLNSKRWVLNVDNVEGVLLEVKKNKSIQYISSFNNNIIIETDIDDTFNFLSDLLKNYKVYKISKDSNLIEYFK